MEHLKAVRVANAVDAKKMAKLSPTKKKQLAELSKKQQVGNFRMPDAPSPKKGKRKVKEETMQVWGSCPLLPGVPEVPPPYVPQRWELKRLHDNTKEVGEDDVIEGTPPKVKIPQQTPAELPSGGTSLQTSSELDIDITNATVEFYPPVNIIPETSTPVSEPVSPARTPPQKRNRKLQFSPLAESVSQSPKSPVNIVPALIEVLDFTTSPATSTAMDYNTSELDVDDVIQHGEGSDVEYENAADVTLKPRDVDEFSVEIATLADPVIAGALSSIDSEADLALRTVLATGTDQDMLSFDWRCEPENFEGVREAFTLQSGPTFDNSKLTPLDIFLKIWDADIIALMVTETNRYSDELLRRNKTPGCRLHRWKDVTEEDIKIFFTIIMLQSLVVNHVEREYWYPQLEALSIGNFGSIMPFNRFLAIKRCLHFVNNASLPEHPNRLDKIMPIVKHLNKKFSSLYVLEQNIAIDESLLLWKGRLSFAQKIDRKKAKVGIKSYELCESRTGYLWRMEVYSGKGHVHAAQMATQELVEDELVAEVESESATSQIVLGLMRPILNRGHTLVMDSFYNAPLLSRILKVKYKTDTMGTLRLNREFVPVGLKSLAKKNMRPGEVAFSSTKDLSVVVWMDKNVVAMISTFHQIKVGGIEKHGYYKYKPQVILDYNLSMGGIDHKDQMLHAYPLERVRNTIWYKKLFRRLLNVSIHNSFVMYNHNRTQVIGNREFRLQLVKELLHVYKPEALARPLQPPPPPPALLQLHLPARNERRQRCKMCRMNNVRSSTWWRCTACAVHLCVESCYTDYHKKMYSLSPTTEAQTPTTDTQTPTFTLIKTLQKKSSAKRSPP